LLSDALNNNKKLDKMFLAATAAGPKKTQGVGLSLGGGGAGVAPSLSIGQQLGQSSKSQQMEGQADDLLEDILGDLDCNISDKDLQQERAKPTSALHMSTPTHNSSRTPLAPASRFARVSRPHVSAQTQVGRERKVRFQQEPEVEEAPPLVAPQEPEEEEQPGDDVILDSEGGTNTQGQQQQKVAPTVKVKQETERNVQGILGSEAEPEVEKTPKSAWESMCDDEVEFALEGQANDTAAAASNMDVDTVADQQSSQESLDFYFLDLHSENSMGAQMKGSVYMFGKVSDGKGGWHSCSVVVRNMLRNLFFVPTPNLLSEDSEAIADLEVKMKEGNNQARGELMKLLHTRFGDLKNEIRSILTRNGVNKFTLVPVKRDYAFELAGIPRGMQWVIKVKYSAQLPELNQEAAASKGENFCGIFGAKTSTSEHLILKRKIKGPGWLKISNPQRVAPERQITWSKQEYEVDSPKMIMVCDENTTAPGKKKKNGSGHPPLTVAAVNVKTFVGPNQSSPEIVSCTVMFLKEVQTDLPTPKDKWNTLKHLRHFSCVRRLDGLPFPVGFEKECQERNASNIGKLNGNSVISHFNSERALLCNVVARIRALDPDVLVGHNVLAFDLDVLYSRMIALKVPHWSRIGRIKRSSLPFGVDKKKGSNQGNTLIGSSITTGRLVCDTYLSAREFVRQPDYSLKSLSSALLGETKVELQMDMSACFSSAKDLLQLVTLAEQDTWLSLGLMFHLSVLPLSRQLTNLSGFQWAKVLRGGRAQRIEYLLLHEFHSRKFMVPDKQSYQNKKKEGGSTKRGKAQYAGGLVLDPKCGLYDDFVLMLDFNSLYPSIIQEYNICFTTVERPQDSQTMASLPPAIGSGDELAILPSVIRRLVQRRRQVKTMLKEERDDAKKQQLDIRQQALKLTANSMYGCLGFSASRFCARALAELVTSQGREILQNTANLAEQNLNLEVVYGDTDSIFVNTRSKMIDEVKRLGNALRKEVNKRYRLLEIEIDAIFLRLLLLKKKKYAAIKLEPSRTKASNGQQEYIQVVEHKGIDIVRRDWSILSKEVGAHVLDLILSGKSSEDVVELIHTHLQSVGNKVKQSTSPSSGDALSYALEKFIITKQLTKRPEDYPDWRAQPHVQVAMRRKKLGKRDGVNPGETIQYVICEQPSSKMTNSPSSGGSGSSMLAERAFHPEEVIASRKKAKAQSANDEAGDSDVLKVDVQYYLAQQVHPVLSRLCESIEGTSAARLADCLGLDSAKYHRQDVQGSGQRSEDALFSAAGSFEDEQRYQTCKPLQIAFPDGTCKDFAGVSEYVKSGGASGDGAHAQDLLSTQIKSKPLKVEATIKTKEVKSETAKVEDGKGKDEGAKAETEKVETYTLSAAQLKNQTQLQMHKLVSDYYDGVLVVDDGFGVINETRSISLRVDPQHGLGHMPADIKISNPVTQKTNESSLYLQLSHFSRLLDTKRVYEKAAGEKEQRVLQRQLASISEQVDSACQLVQHTKDRSQFKWGFDKNFWKRACGLSS
jgi:DNA polymerase alpha subunit A